MILHDEHDVRDALRHLLAAEHDQCAWAEGVSFDPGWTIEQKVSGGFGGVGFLILRPESLRRTYVAMASEGRLNRPVGAARDALLITLDLIGQVRTGAIDRWIGLHASNVMLAQLPPDKRARYVKLRQSPDEVIGLPAVIEALRAEPGRKQVLEAIAERYPAPKRGRPVDAKLLAVGRQVNADRVTFRAILAVCRLLDVTPKALWESTTGLRESPLGMRVQAADSASSGRKGERAIALCFPATATATLDHDLALTLAIRLAGQEHPQSLRAIQRAALKARSL